MQKGLDYIVISELSPEEQTPLRAWLIGQTRPKIDQEPGHEFDCCFIQDYKTWKDYWQEGKYAPIYD
jgi:hypothetical protein